MNFNSIHQLIPTLILILSIDSHVIATKTRILLQVVQAYPLV